MHAQGNRRVNHEPNVIPDLRALGLEATALRLACLEGMAPVNPELT